MILSEKDLIQTRTNTFNSMHFGVLKYKYGCYKNAFSGQSLVKVLVWSGFSGLCKHALVADSEVFDVPTCINEHYYFRTNSTPHNFS